MQIATIEGVPINKNLIGKIPQKEYLPFADMTEGNLKLKLLQRQLQLVAAASGKDYRPQIDFIENVVVNNAAPSISRIGSNLDPFQNFIKAAAAQQQPAAFGGAAVGSQTAGTSRQQYENCINKVKSRYSRVAWGIKTGKKKDELFQEAGCNGFLVMEAVLNANLELAGNANLYSGFLSPEIAITNNVVFAKRNIQKFHSQTLSELSGLSLENINGFYRNGVLAALAEQPEAVLNKLARKNIATGQSAGESAGGTDFSGIITAITKGIESITKIINDLKNSGFAEKLSSVTMPSRSTAPDADDFVTKNGDDTPPTTNEDFWDAQLFEWLPLQNKILLPTAAAAAAAGIFLITNKNK